ncbi:hypothetical protein ATCC90586_002588 [Pythium insidiosum]|nr:hypothetical protein ATCC90586_002588 [Pythium insidiosum]
MVRLSTVTSAWIVIVVARVAPSASACSLGAFKCFSGEERCITLNPLTYVSCTYDAISPIVLDKILPAVGDVLKAVTPDKLDFIIDFGITELSDQFKDLGQCISLFDGKVVKCEVLHQVHACVSTFSTAAGSLKKAGKLATLTKDRLDKVDTALSLVQDKLIPALQDQCAAGCFNDEKCSAPASSGGQLVKTITTVTTKTECYNATVDPTPITLEYKAPAGCTCIEGTATAFDYDATAYITKACAKNVAYYMDDLTPPKFLGKAYLPEMGCFVGKSTKNGCNQAVQLTANQIDYSYDFNWNLNQLQFYYFIPCVDQFGRTFAERNKPVPATPAPTYCKTVNITTTTNTTTTSVRTGAAPVLTLHSLMTSLLLSTRTSSPERFRLASLSSLAERCRTAASRDSVDPWRLTTEGSTPILPADAWRHLLLVPSSRFWVLWSVLHLAALGYICTVMPFLTALPLRDAWSDHVNYAINVFYALDLLVSFRACFVDPETGEVVTCARRIARQYLSSPWFAFDLVMALPMDLLAPSDGASPSGMSFIVRMLRLLRLAKMLRILRFQQLLELCEDTIGVNRNKLMVLQLVGTIVLVAHLTACGFIMAATNGSVSDGATSWIDANGLRGAPRSEVYVAALYWAFTMMTTVGFGDIVPITMLERMYSILAMVISAGTYAYVIASMSSIVSLMNLQRARYHEKINELNAYMSSRQVPSTLQLRTRQFFRYYLSKKTVFDEHGLFEVLPTNLRHELVEHYLKTAMQHLAVFERFGDRGFMRNIALHLHPVFFPPLCVVLQQDDHATEIYVRQQSSQF